MTSVLIVLPPTWGECTTGVNEPILSDELDNDIERIRDRHSEVTIDTVFNGTIDELRSNVYPRCYINENGRMVVRLEGSPGVPLELLRHKPQKDASDWERLFADIERFGASYKRRHYP